MLVFMALFSTLSTSVRERERERVRESGRGSEVNVCGCVFLLTFHTTPLGLLLYVVVC